MSVQLQGEGLPVWGAQGSLRPSQANVHGLCHLAIPSKALFALGPGGSRDRAAADGMYGMGMSSEEPVLPGTGFLLWEA